MPDQTTAPVTTAGTRRQRTPRHSALIVSIVGMVLAGLSHRLLLSAFTCDGGMECLGESLAAGYFAGVGAPLIAILVLWWAGVARGPLVGLSGCAVGAVLAIDVALLNQTRPGLPWHPIAPLWVYLLIGALGGLAGLLLAGRGPWPRWSRLLVLAGLVALAALGYVLFEPVAVG